MENGGRVALIEWLPLKQISKRGNGFLLVGLFAIKLNFHSYTVLKSFTPLLFIIKTAFVLS